MSKKLFTLKQGFGACYGYSSLWAKNPEIILPNPQPRVINVLPANEVVKSHHENVTTPCYTNRIPKLYKDEDRDAFLIDMKSKLVNVGDAVVITYFGPIASHALSIRKVNENTYHYFDCNFGIYEFSEEELNTFPAYIHKIYKNNNYGYAFEYLS